MFSYFSSYIFKTRIFYHMIGLSIASARLFRPIAAGMVSYLSFVTEQNQLCSFPSDHVLFWLSLRVWKNMAFISKHIWTTSLPMSITSFIWLFYKENSYFKCLKYNYHSSGILLHVTHCKYHCLGIKNQSYVKSFRSAGISISFSMLLIIFIVGVIYILQK